MFRLSILTAVFVCLLGPQLRGDDPSALLIAASHQRTASSLPPLPHGTRVVVLIQDSGDDYATVNARALSARDATHIVFDRTDQPLLIQMFRERLTRRRAIPVELRKPWSQPLGLENAIADASPQTSFANLFSGPQQ
ncbi:hypothetical protein Poly24_31140 [Rosistilla carotiformis]|uniref:Uncharacterized protein n=1 Tax=Rosistilla carotiformis TaxID=2528017 RepID=A0A518JV43_9BACT|nr:hypothetical protein [Rosistilla carotiformis]QDV69398.1 hypothetical protein Poly24_31140 [Rosistilla carotiformis]